MADMKSKKRNQVGQDHSQAILTEDKVKEIIRRLAGKEKQKVLAEEYGVSVPTISDIKTGKSWKHLERPWRLSPLMVELEAASKEVKSWKGGLKGSYKLFEKSYIENKNGK